MPGTKLLRNFDALLLLCVIGLTVYGIAMIHSASQVLITEGGFFDQPPVRQSVYAILGLGALVLFAVLDYRMYRRIAWGLYGATIVLLVLVLLIGDISYGARRWIDLPFIQFQPSEVGKLAVIMVLARMVTADERRIRSLPFLILTAVVAAVPASLVLIEPDLGTTSIYMLIWLAVVAVGGARPWHLAVLIAPALVAAFLAVQLQLLPAYQMDRLRTFVDPAEDALGRGYNILQAEIAIGSGGLLGKGYLEGTQSQLHFLRVQRTDFIFSVLGEELGFVGAVGLLMLFVVFALRGVRAAGLAPDSYGRLLAVGIVTLIVAQTFINVGANIRLLPFTGIPLPFISMGGTSLIAKLVAVGLLESIAMRRRKADSAIPVAARHEVPRRLPGFEPAPGSAPARYP